MNPDKFQAHLLQDHYGDFRLTEAIRPSMDLRIVPREGWRKSIYKDPDGDLEVPVLAASVSAEKLFEVFLALLEPLGEVVNIVLESSHDGHDKQRDLVREGIDNVVLTSHLYDFEDLLLNDGCTGIAVIAEGRPMEVQFDEHKLLVVYARDPKPFERVLRQAGIQRDDSLVMLTEGEHLHSTDDRFLDAFEQLSYRLGVGEQAEVLG